MKITVIGAGNMGSAFVKQLTRAGHQVSVTARDGAKAAKVAADNTGAKAVAVAGAAQDADAVVRVGRAVGLSCAHQNDAVRYVAVAGLDGDCADRERCLIIEYRRPCDV